MILSKMATNNTLPPISQVVGPHAFTYEAFFKQADVRGSGKIGAAQAAAFLKQSGLRQSVLSQIWDLADPAHRGYLDKQGFCVALKLIALVQNGKEANMSNIGQPAPLPKMGPEGSGGAVTANTAADWAILPTEKAKYDKIFDSLGPTNDLLPGSRVKPVLLNSKLANEILGQIWNLSDMDNDGFLDREEFAVAMHLVYKSLEKVPVPDMLPTDVVPPGKRTLRRRCSSGSFVGPALSSLTSSPSSSSPSSVPGGGRPVARSGSLTGMNTSVGAGLPRRDQPQSQWVVNADDKAKYDAMFLKADTDRDGFVNGAEIKGIFLKSGLPQATLAHIWSLCDFRGVGKLNPDQFALAMHLVSQKLKGVEPPAKLPPNMLTPLIRRRSLVDGMIPAGMNVDYSSPGLKELDKLGTELEQLRRRKLEAEQEKNKMAAEVRGFSTEVTTLVTELESVAAAVKQIDTQKREAQKRLDDLDQKKLKLEAQLKLGEQAYIAGQKELEDLKTELVNEQERGRNADVEIKAKREELNSLRQQELELELKVESGHHKLVHLSKQLHGTQVQIKQMEQNVSQLEDARTNLSQTFNLYNALFNNEITLRQAMQTGSLTSPVAIDMNMFSMEAAMSDVMSMTTAELDELQAKLNIDINGLDDDLDKYGEGGADPFTDAHAAVESAKPNNEVEEVDWTQEFGERRAAHNDPFAVGIITEIKSPLNDDDPFGTGTFVVEGKNKLLYPGGKPPRPSGGPSGPPKRPNAPPQRPKSPSQPDRPRSPNPPERPRSPVPPRPKSPAPPQRPSGLPGKGSGAGPQRPPQPSRTTPTPTHAENNGMEENDSAWSTIGSSSYTQQQNMVTLDTPIFVTLSLCVLLHGGLLVESAGSGRAFPIDSENYVTDRFIAINPNLAWDESNFLVDLAGHYANCKSVGVRGTVRVDKLTPEGKEIIAVVDYAEGGRSDVDGVNEYIQRAIDRWIESRQFDEQIRGAKKFGCSVRPSCSGQVAIACLFSGSGLGGGDGAENLEDPDMANPPGTQHALAFTPEQYELAEKMTGNKWDRSHLLENLSGFETDCAMIHTDDWPFSKAKYLATDLNIRVLGTYGYTENTSGTPEALDKIMHTFKKIRQAKAIGCSIIPDCVLERERAMYVVVSCIYEE